MSGKILLITLITTFFWWSAASAQQHPAPVLNSPASDSAAVLAPGQDPGAHADTAAVRNIQQVFTKGHFHGHVRNYFMATWNHRELSDNYANAIGAEIGYRTAWVHGFRMGFAGLFTYHMFSSGIHEQDPITGKHPKLELELFDVEDAENKADLDRLDELYLEYQGKGLKARVGRFGFTSPLINPLDTRMKPYSVQGLDLQVPLYRHGLLTLAWLDHFSPRSTVSWFKAGESIGIYTPGLGTGGNPSAYPHHTNSRGVAVAGLQHSSRKLSAQAWNYYIDNISNNSYGRVVMTLAPRLQAGLEGLYQARVGTGGNSEEDHAYFPDQRQWLAGGMLAFEPQDAHFSVNYLHVGTGGRFLFPREWGREQFFATVSRGRMEGSGKSDLLVGKARKHWSDRFSSEAAVMKAWLPAADDHRHNKYGAVSYWGWLADLQYKPANPVLQGLSFRLLYVGRVSPNHSLPLKDVYYNTNFHNLNLVTQISF